MVLGLIEFVISVGRQICIVEGVQILLQDGYDYKLMIDKDTDKIFEERDQYGLELFKKFYQKT